MSFIFWFSCIVVLRTLNAIFYWLHRSLGVLICVFSFYALVFLSVSVYPTGFTRNKWIDWLIIWPIKTIFAAVDERIKAVHVIVLMFLLILSVATVTM